MLVLTAPRSDHHCAAGKLWGSAQYLRPRQDNALSQAELSTVRWTLKQFTLALNNAQRASTPRSLGSYLREAWLRVSTAAVLALMTLLWWLWVTMCLITVAVTPVPPGT